MKWYSIRDEFDPKVVGNVRGIQSEYMFEGYNYGGEYSVRRIANKNFDCHRFLKIDFGRIRLKPAALYTDLISSVLINKFFVLVLSKALSDYLKKFQLPPIFEKEVGVSHPKLQMELEYRAFYMENNYNLINFDKSRFLIGENGTPYENDVIKKFQDKDEFEDFLHAKSWKVRLRVGKLVVKTNYDLIRFRTLGGYFVSEKLKEAIEQEGFTGMRFEPADFVISEP